MIVTFYCSIALKVFEKSVPNCWIHGYGKTCLKLYNGSRKTTCNKFYFIFCGHINVDNLVKVYIFLIRIKWRLFGTIKNFDFFNRKTVDLSLKYLKFAESSQVERKCTVSEGSISVSGWTLTPLSAGVQLWLSLIHI